MLRFVFLQDSSRSRMIIRHRILSIYHMKSRYSPSCHLFQTFYCFKFFSFSFRDHSLSSGVISSSSGVVSSSSGVVLSSSECQISEQKRIESHITKQTTPMKAKNEIWAIWVSPYRYFVQLIIYLKRKKKKLDCIFLKNLSTLLRFSLIFSATIFFEKENQFIFFGISNLDKLFVHREYFILQASCKTNVVLQDSLFLVKLTPSFNIIFLQESCEINFSTTVSRFFFHIVTLNWDPPTVRWLFRQPFSQFSILFWQICLLIFIFFIIHKVNISV